MSDRNPESSVRGAHPDIPSRRPRRQDPDEFLPGALGRTLGTEGAPRRDGGAAAGPGRAPRSAGD